MEFRTLRESDEQAFDAAVREFRELEPEWGFAFHYDEAIDFGSYVRSVEAWARGEDLPDGFVPNTFFVAIANGAVVGRLSLRHRLCASIEEVGGHIGYGVVPSQRGRGYATEMVRRALPVAARLGLDRVLLTCADSNTVSARVIEKCGGVFERTATDADGIICRRYWIATS